MVVLQAVLLKQGGVARQQFLLFVPLCVETESMFKGKSVMMGTFLELIIASLIVLDLLVGLLVVEEA